MSIMNIIWYCKDLPFIAFDKLGTVNQNVFVCPKKSEKLKIALYQSQREIHTVAARAAPGDLGLKSQQMYYQQKVVTQKVYMSTRAPNVTSM